LEVLAFQRALREFVLTVDDSYGKKFENFYVGFEGSFGGKHVSPRTVSARHLGNLICVEGIVTKCELLNATLSFSDVTCFVPLQVLW